MTQPRHGRPPHPLDPDASHAARLGAEIRARRQAQGLTLKALAALIGFSPQHISEVELAKVPMSGPFVAACDRALEAHGSVLDLLPAVVCERAMQRHERSAARNRSAGQVPDAEWEALARALGLARYAGPQHPSEAGDDVDPINRRSLLGAGAGAALSLGATTAPAAARDIDPGLVEHWIRLRRVLDHHGGMYGPHSVRDTVRRELGLIAKHREVAQGALRTDLLRVEARWSDFASWLSYDTGDSHRRDAWADRALRLAQEADWPDLVTYVFTRRSHWAAQQRDARSAISLARAGLRTAGAGDEIRAVCTLREAQGHALANDVAACERSLSDARRLLGADTAPAPWGDLGSDEITPVYLLAAEADCWLLLRPSKAIAMFEDVLHRWPRDRTRDRGLRQARLALACAADEPERACAEGHKALSIAQATKSDVIVRELTRLDHRLAACDAPATADFHEAFAAL